jgi:hypothetical protein
MIKDEIEKINLSVKEFKNIKKTTIKLDIKKVINK